jgi:hypothetical protein
MQCAEILLSPTGELTSLLAFLPGILETFVIGMATLLRSLNVERLCQEIAQMTVLHP